MNKRFTKIICLVTATVAAAGITVATGCGGSYSATPLKGNIFTEEAAKSNGGFAVEKGDYIYFLNGVENNTAENSYGTPVKGAVYRIKKDDLADRKYSTVDRVVPLVAYSGDYNSGLFIYGDRIYYSTPSTQKNSSGETLNTNLDMKSSKLDGTDTMKDAYVQFPSLTTEYRYVEGKDGKVYLMYLATDEKLYEEETGVKNLHSLNTENGENTLLAYNVDSVLFDAEDKTNATVYYTMNVRNYATDSNYSYNQVYSVTADTKTANEYDTSAVLGWDGETDRYINCGTLVFDGIGQNNEKTPFNAKGDETNLSDFTYALKKYQNGTLFYTRKTSVNDSEYLFSFKDSALASHNPVTGNANSDDRILTDGSSAGDYKYIFKDGELEKVIIAESNGGIAVNYVDESGKLQTKISTVSGSKYYYIVKNSSATMLFADENYLYYTASSVINRVGYNGDVDEYEGLPETDDTDEFSAVKILDLAPTSSWYAPEMFYGQLLFASETENMSNYKYVMACDLRNGQGKVMSNAEIAAFNKKFEGISKVISDFSDSDNYDADVYANLGDALRYAFFTGEKEYIKELAEKCNAEVEEGGTLVYSAETLAKFAQFFEPKADNEWSEYTAKKEVNGKEIYENRRDYYYTLLGVMSETDAEAYTDAVKGNYLKSEPVNEQTWWEGLDTASQVWFIIGMCLIGILVIGGACVLTVILVRRKKNKLPDYSKRKIKVDTTDDKDIDVYGTDEE